MIRISRQPEQQQCNGNGKRNSFNQKQRINQKAAQRTLFRTWQSGAVTMERSYTTPILYSRCEHGHYHPYNAKINKKHHDIYVLRALDETRARHSN